METFLGIVVEQTDKCIKIHLDNYVKDVIAKYSGYIKKSLRPKKVLISQGIQGRRHCDEACQGSDCTTDGGHPDQGTTSTTSSRMR